MVNPVSSAPPVSESATPQKTAQAKVTQAAPEAPQDTAHVSAKAQAQAAGDVDHDGDSH
jgi:hypothetical protein